jgi:uncharacterized protein (TIGR03435 family)
MDQAKFDIIAKPPTTSATRPELQAMLQTLLAERFQLKARKLDKPFPVYVWTAAKNGLRLTPSKSETQGDCNSQPGDGYIVRNCTGMTVEELGQQVRYFANGYFYHEVIDRTGAKGRYDFMLKWSGVGQVGLSADTISLYDVLEKQYGIKTSQESTPLPAVVVESANEAPSANPPDTDMLLPPLPTEFEVATVKLDKDPQAKPNFRFVGGRIDVRAIVLRDIIEFAYGFDDDKMIVGAPSWVEHELYDLVAKTDPSVDFVGAQPMLQKLLEEQFKLKSHREDRPVEAYALTVGKGDLKLTPGDAAARSDCKRTVDRGAFTLKCENTTMAEFTEVMRRYAPGYIDLPVTDQTGMKGAFNFSVTWNGRAATDPAAAGRGGSASGEIADPGSGTTFFTAVEKIGLKLSKGKRPLPVLVVDKIEHPSEN